MKKKYRSNKYYNDQSDNFSHKFEKDVRKEKGKKSPIDVALRFIKFRARSQWEVENRLKRDGFDEGTIQETIQKLKERGFIDDEKFAYLYAYDSLVIHYKGPYRIRYELRQLHVDEYIIEDAIKKVLEEVDVNEIIEKITQNLDEQKKREKLYRQGFGGDWK
ncbi:MAG: regulatory protein RecX [Fervidobacterium sp.]|uniref:Regulatory protein RecX n=1 Tax=Fervidobacterium gondwanense DSM 13020 TaxID=1121883 RepID=A0A1M7SR67_FERGO|nr:regulatory protein RecX [Fervidobacterium gondwanense]SHN60952.1 regulatory protein [Fervidobacterium gondwanense DSM 13020]